MNLDRAYQPPDCLPEDRTGTTLEWVAKNFKVDEVFPYAALEQWALANGWVQQAITNEELYYRYMNGELTNEEPDRTLTLKQFLEWCHLTENITLEDYLKTLNK